MGFGVWGLGFGVWGLGFGVWGLGFGVWGLGFGVWGLGFGVWGLGFGVWGLGCARHLSMMLVLLPVSGSCRSLLGWIEAPRVLWLFLLGGIADQTQTWSPECRIRKP